MNVFVTRLLTIEPQTWEKGQAEAFAEELRVLAPTIYKVVEQTENSELIILIESNKHKTEKSIPLLLQDPTLAKFCDRVCSVNYEDAPAGFLRGLYTSLEGNRFDSSIHKSWPALHLPNEQVYEIDERLICNTRPNHLFSFIGSMSHPLRQHLMSRYSAPSPVYEVIESKGWYNHTPEQKQNYIDNILFSHFALCPRGHAGYTHRISEAMALGRVPVIIADHWIPFSIPETDYFIRVPEESIDDLEPILEARRPEAGALGRRAREIWLKYFARATRAQAAVDAASELVAGATEPLTLATYRRRWQSAQFKRVNQMQLWQRAWRRCKNFSKGR